MNLLSILLTAFALSMDAFAVSVTKGMSLKKSSNKISIKIALFFGLFQGVMPLLGWILGISFQNYIKSIDHWVALILLSILGFKMIYEFIENPCKDCSDDSSITSEISVTSDSPINDYTNNISNKELTTLAIATSIDALAIGVSFAFLNVNIISSSILIAITTFVVCFIGVSAGKKIGCLFKNYAELIGGLLLIFIGISIFNEHTGFLSNLLKSIIK